MASSQFVAPPEVLIFDLGNVIVAHDNDLLWRRIADLGAEVAAEAVARLVRGSGIGDGRVSVASLHDRLVDELGLDADYGRFLDAWSSHFKPIAEMETLIEELAPTRRLAILSNTNAEHWEHLEARYAVLRHFDPVLLSHELGLLKPDTAIYAAAVARVGAAAARCFFTDDLESNVAGARAAGLDAVRFESAEQLREQLARRGIPPGTDPSR